MIKQTIKNTKSCISNKFRMTYFHVNLVFPSLFQFKDQYKGTSTYPKKDKLYSFLPLNVQLVIERFGVQYDQYFPSFSYFAEYGKQGKYWPHCAR